MPKPIYEIVGGNCFTDGCCDTPTSGDYPYTLGRKVLYQQQIIINQGDIICLADYKNEVIIIESTREEYFLNMANMPNRKYYVIFRAVNPTVIHFPKQILFNGELKEEAFDIKIKAEEELCIEVLCAKEAGRSIILVSIAGYDSNGKIVDQVKECTCDMSGLIILTDRVNNITETVNNLETRVSGIYENMNDLADMMEAISGFHVIDIQNAITRIDNLTEIVTNNTTAIEGIAYDVSELQNQIDGLTVTVEDTTLKQGDTELVKFVGVADRTIVAKKDNTIEIDVNNKLLDDGIYDDGEW